MGRLFAESDSGGGSTGAEPLPLGRWSNPEPRVSNTNPSAPTGPTGSGSYVYPGADAPYVNTAGQTVPTYGANQPQQAQYQNPSYPPQYPAYPPAGSQPDPLSNFGQLSLNSTAGGQGSLAPYTNATAPSYSGYQSQTYQDPQQAQQYGQAGQQSSWNQAPVSQPGLYQQGSGNHQQQGSHVQSAYPSYTPAAGYNQQGSGQYYQ